MALKTIVNACIFDKNAGTPNYFDRTPGTATSTTTWTLSLWFKRGENVADSTAATILSAGTATTDRTVLSIDGR